MKVLAVTLVHSIVLLVDRGALGVSSCCIAAAGACHNDDEAADSPLRLRLRNLATS